MTAANDGEQKQDTGSRKAKPILRGLLTGLAIVAWLVIGGIGGPYFGRVNEVSTNDSTQYLPDSAEATRVQSLLGAFNGSSQMPAIIVFEGDHALSPEEVAALGGSVASLTSTDGVGAASPAIPSSDGLAAQAFITVDPGAELTDTIAAVEEVLRDGLPAGVTSYVTGPAGLIGDLVNAFKGIGSLLLIVALLAV